ncbi:MAG: class I SAM-dependent methyltransferase [Propionibacteriaceae bacterium]
MLDYDAEAPRYDASRGGTQRAAAAARAVHSLIRFTPAGDTVVDLAGGTGIVTAALAQLGHRVLVLDASHGMLALARNRLPGGVCSGDATRTPLRTGGCGVVLTIWLLHLLDDAEPVITEVARVLRPGGLFVTTVDKNAAHRRGDDRRAPATDDPALVASVCRSAGLMPAGRARFIGHGQGRDDQPDPVFELVSYVKAG